jgi:hypothetical protein
MLIRRLLGLLGSTYSSKEAILQQEFLDLAFRRLRLGHTPTANEIERAVSVIDSGQLDAMIEQGRSRRSLGRLNFMPTSSRSIMRRGKRGTPASDLMLGYPLTKKFTL